MSDEHEHDYQLDNLMMDQLDYNRFLCAHRGPVIARVEYLSEEGRDNNVMTKYAIVFEGHEGDKNPDIEGNMNLRVIPLSAESLDQLVGSLVGSWDDLVEAGLLPNSTKFSDPDET